MRTTPLTTTLAALAVAGLLGACGGSGGGSSSDDVASASDDESDEQAQADDEGDTEQELLDWVECMRDEGVDIPDPTRDADGDLVISGNGIEIGGGEGGASTSSDNGDEGDEGPSFTPEEMEAAEEVCGPPPGLGAGDISEEDQQAMQDAALEFAQCMREEGIEDFPDPDFSDMGPGGAPQRRSSDGEASESGDSQVVLGPFGEIDLDDPEVAAAFEACQDLLGDGPSGGPGGGPDSEAPPAEGSGA
jgi:hypothetical protein